MNPFKQNSEAHDDLLNGIGSKIESKDAIAALGIMAILAIVRMCIDRSDNHAQH